MREMNEIKAIDIAMICMHKIIKELDKTMLFSSFWVKGDPPEVREKEDILDAMELLKNRKWRIQNS